MLVRESSISGGRRRRRRRSVGAGIRIRIRVVPISMSMGVVGLVHLIVVTILTTIRCLIICRSGKGRGSRMKALKKKTHPGTKSEPQKSGGLEIEGWRHF